MKIAIYSRKSRQTDKGESMENQVQLCRQYIDAHFGKDNEILIYEDEGFSGGHTDRPMFQQMIKDAKAKKFNVLMCYRLDRVSRNVSDFSSTLDMLQDKGIDFISIRESFDTSTPMGRAMIHIASVFAQLERETIAERIRDNMVALARTGRWLGGNTPTGFDSKSIEYLDYNGNEKKMFKLTPVIEELEIVKLLFDKYLELGSLTKVETYCLQNNIKSRTDTSFSVQSIRHILLNPVYCIADNAAYKYMEQLGTDIACPCSDFDGKHALMVYNKTEQKKGRANKFKDYSDWIVAIGRHKGIITSSDWITVQERMNRNKHRAIRQGTGKFGLLSGLLKCGECGDYMRVRLSRKDKAGKYVYYYLCTTKERSRGVKCKSSNIRGNDLDLTVVNEIKSMCKNQTKIVEYINTNEKSLISALNLNKAEREAIEKQITTNETAIKNLIIKLSATSSEVIERYIEDQINELHSSNKKLQLQLYNLENKTEEQKTEQLSIGLIKDALLTFSKQFDTSDLIAKRNLLKTIIQDILWDGEKAKINMYAKMTGE